jgi:hypothetical protein
LTTVPPTVDLREQPPEPLMVTPRRSALVLVLALAACRAATDSPTAPNARPPAAGVSFVKPVDPGSQVCRSGSTTDMQTQPIGGAYLAGGGTAIAWDDRSCSWRACNRTEWRQRRARLRSMRGRV